MWGLAKSIVVHANRDIVTLGLLYVPCVTIVSDSVVNLCPPSGEDRRVRVRRWRKLALALVICFLATAVNSERAAAACDTGRAFNDGYWFSSWSRVASSIPNETLGYAASEILEYSPYVAPTGDPAGDGENVSASVMIWNDTTPQAWSQVGWIKFENGNRRMFSQWTDVPEFGHWSTRYYGAYPAGNFTLYEVYWDPNTQRIQHWANGAILVDHLRYFTMRKAEVLGETHEYRSQMPGGTASHERFRNSYVGNLSNGIYAFNGTPFVTDSAIHSASKVSTTRLDVWDNACGT